jgi:hypothetical protein
LQGSNNCIATALQNRATTPGTLQPRQHLQHLQHLPAQQT